MDDLFEYPNSLKNCSICPRNCGADRIYGKPGYCGTDAGFSISSIMIHRGEEPVISGKNGICNIFFTGCNLKCIFCQNFQISRQDSPKTKMKLENVIRRIAEIVDTGINAVGFVSTSHVVPQIIAIIKALHLEGLHPTIVYNTNGYERPETIKGLEGLVDVYLPDFKYISPSLAKEYSDAADYPEFASLAIKEMYRQKGSTLHIDDEGQAERGILIRHLVLPYHAEESIKVLKYIADEISTGVHVALMSQYYPCDKAIAHPKIGRGLLKKEYKRVVDEFYNLGFRNGWIQGLESHLSYRPDFDKDEPFVNWYD
jgi:putative pyruvate formate lyase activating enzyme